MTRTTYRKWGVAFLCLAILLGLFISLAHQSIVADSQVIQPPASSVISSSTAAAPAVAIPPPDTYVARPSTLPPKAEPTRLTITSASIDTPVSHLNMTPEQIAQRVYTPPETPQGYYVKFSENGVTPFDLPGKDTTGATWIIGHSCDGLAICEQGDWQFNRLSDPQLVRVGTSVSITTTAGKVCYRTLSVAQVPAQDAATQNKILNDAVKNRYLVLTSCFPQDIHGQNTFVVAALESCG